MRHGTWEIMRVEQAHASQSEACPLPFSLTQFRKRLVRLPTHIPHLTTRLIRRGKESRHDGVEWIQ